MLCYAVGFAITNIYLGSLGIVSVELARPRYILAGMLFLVFCAAIGLLVSGCLRVLRNSSSSSEWKAFGEVGSYSVKYLSLLYVFAIPAVALLGGYGLPARIDVDTAGGAGLPWSEWLRVEPLRSLRFVLFMAVFMGTALALLMLLVVLINPRGKDGLRTSRRQVLTEIVRSVAGFKVSHAIRAGAIVAMVTLIQLSGSLLTFMQTGVMSRQSRVDGPILDSGWLRFFIAIAGLYLMIAAFLMLSSVTPRDSEPQRSPVGIYSWVWLVSIAISIVIPLYSVAVYPYVPQQAGGGRSIPVQVVAAGTDFGTAVGGSDASCYLIDRTSTSVILLITHVGTQDRRIVELPTRLIDRLLYLGR